MKNTELEAIIENFDLVGEKDIFSVLEREHIDLPSLDVLNYINQHYAIKPDVMRELKKDENVKRILGGTTDLSNELYLTYINDTCENFCVRITDFEKGRGFGFWRNTEWTENGWNWRTFPEYWRKSTPEEIKLMLVKKLEADGLKVGCKATSVVNGRDYEISKLEFKYNEEEDFMTIPDVCTVYEKGKFAKIIKPELTIEQRLERLEKYLKID